ncbi:tyrosine-type recombinase/integrase [Paenibacillus gansuensis]|uniref:Tyrosine-type recombinase/integrase n=1 Tax=Paenibacillus gansuensis TaxID=306542 RepID=A0ABW5PDX9_9BACL
MKVVQPIRDRRRLQAFKDYLLKTDFRNYALFMLGINTALRISDILPLKVWMVKGTHINLVTEKTDKRMRIKINKELRKVLDQLIEGKDDEDYLFPGRSRKKISGRKNEPISRSMAYKILAQAGKKFGLDNIGCHTMRKTCAYHLYERTKDIALLMELLGHTEPSDSLRYIGALQDLLDSALDENPL